MTPTALVVFTDQRQIRALGWLRSGFRHCFVVVRDPDGEWLACDWLVGRMSFRVYGQQTPQTLIERFVAAGHRVAAVPAIRHGRRAWLRPMTCVEVVKQVIGIGTVRPLTPYGLYRELRAAGYPVFGVTKERKKFLDHRRERRYREPSRCSSARGVHG